MDTVQRSSALERISLLASSREEGALIVCGTPGSGRTHLIESALASVATHAILVRISRAEMLYPLSGLSAVLTKIGDARLAQFTGRFALVSTDNADLFAAAETLLMLLRGLALEPVLVFVDDIDQMDKESLAILSYMSTRLSSTNVSLVASIEAVGDDMAGLALSERGAPGAVRLSPLSAFSGVSSVLLAPLTPNEIAHLIAETVPLPLDDALVQIVCSYADGLPLAIMQMLPSVESAGTGSLVLPFRLGARTRHIARQAVSGLTAPALQLFKNICAAPLTHLDALLDESTEASDALDELLASGVVTAEAGCVRVSSGLVRSGTYWAMPAIERREIHTLMAERNQNIDAAMAVWHESWISPHNWGAKLLLAAATALAAGGHRSAAIECCERARGNQLPPDRIDDHLRDLATAFFEHGDLIIALRYCQISLDADIPPSEALELQLIKTHIEFLLDEHLSPNEVEARLEDSQPGSTALTLRLLGAMAFVRAERGEASGALELLSRIDREVYPGRAGPLLQWEHSVVTALAGGLEPREIQQAALDSSGISSMPLALQTLVGRTLSFAEHHAQARKVFVGTLVHAGESDRALHEVSGVYAAENDVRSGHLHYAIRFVGDLSSASEVFRFRRTLLQAWSLEVRGLPSEARALMAECESMLERERNPVLAARLFSAEGTFDLMRGNVEQALGYFHRVRAVTLQMSLALHARHDVDLIEATLMAGSRREAQVLFLDFDELCARMPSRWATLAGARARALLAPDALTIAAFDSAISDYRPDDSPYELGRLMLSYAYRLDQLSQFEHANRVRANARQIFASIGANGWVLASIRPHRVPEPPPKGVGLLVDLTPSEQEIVVLLQHGHRNKEIAARLFVSLRTVEVRLTHVYRKTGAHSRADLLAMLWHAETESSSASALAVGPAAM
ncbi:helix-turn-helix transcriptional regulator [Subtercola sp. RTI3]|uniref:helix-turn-helix transcriptional regulator n=1 Tax=Subtercola sp. RTI3 TaxID=3048639 RepID=UPI002B22927F|nr:LuxR C-terminal-related transcriptional regulator [Subtercola sp. RTI3]MEA9986341.1 LuxR C-terminal-related transcriptional regulator [Subtercola sp. RTI3]